MSKLIVVPSSPADLKRLKDAMIEGSNSLVRIDSEKELLKDIIEVVSEELDLPKSMVSALIRHYHKSSFDEKATEFSDFTELWEAVSAV